MTEGNPDLAQSQLFTLKGEIASKSQQATTRRDLAGQIIDQKYKLISLLGEGGMGSVYRAHHLMLDKEVALKTFRSPNLTEESWNRFQREAQAIAKLNHPNIVQVFDFGVSEDNVPYYTMECLVGEALSDRLLRQKFIPLDEAMRIFIQVCQGLSLAHSKGIIHRDMKPANIFMARSVPGGPAETVKIVDFGVAGLATQSMDGQKLTATGTIFGSPFYMSPEQSLGLEMSERSDIYSVGCSLYECLTGEPPFHGENAFATMLLHQMSAAQELTHGPDGTQYPQRLTGLISRMLAKNERNRVQTFAEVASDLQNILQSEQIKTQTGKQQTLSAIRKPGYNKEEDLEDQVDEEPDEDGSNQVGIFAGKKALLLTASLIGLLILGTTSFYFLSNHSKQAAVPITKNADDVEILTLHKPQPVKIPAAPYLVSKTETEKRYVFPEKSIGHIHWVYEKNKTGPRSPKKIEAQGEVVIPAGAKLYIMPNAVLEQQPELFTFFSPEDLSQLSIDATYKWTNKHMVYISNFTDLIVLGMHDTAIDDAAVPYLERLQKLRSLALDHTFMSSGAIAGLSILPRLDKLSVSGIQNITPVLRKLSDSRELTSLEVDSCSLKDSDLAIISTMKRLKNLCLRDNPNLTDRGFAVLAALQNLEGLSIENTNLSAAILPTLQKLPHLKRLSSDIAQWPKADQNTFRGSLNCRFIRAQATDLKNLRNTDIEGTAQELFQN
ncbi:MAG: serine/threonine protein kinase [Cyanobacteria bacterium SZAS TMP-1]|nr:serine/threonine protein kinase [Cyanobacteria bacterium SZAS TMP-1]